MIVPGRHPRFGYSWSRYECDCCFELFWSPPASVNKVAGPRSTKHYCYDCFHDFEPHAIGFDFSRSDRAYHGSFHGRGDR